MNTVIDARRENSNATAKRLFDAATAELEATAAMLQDANALLIEAAKIQRRKGKAA
jgi:hypothetical protein